MHHVLHFACTIAFGTAGFTTYYTMLAPDWLRDAYSPRESLCTVALSFPVSYTRHWPLCCHLSGFCHVGSGGLVATHNTRKDVVCVIAVYVFKEQQVWGPITPAFVPYESPAFHISTNQRLVYQLLRGLSSSSKWVVGGGK